jgi:exopolysaccharide production protein ExoZ
MRGLAACWVLAYHANESVIVFVSPTGGQGAWAKNGSLGVDFFFVLSGFIIAYSCHRILESGRGFVDYAKARLIRIYVPYLPAGIGILFLYALFPHLSAATRSSPGLLTSLTLLPSNHPPALGVAWTLMHEIIFYAFFSLIFFSRAALWILMASWVALIVYYASLGLPLTLGQGLEPVLAPINLLFPLGVAVYYATRKGVATWMAVPAVVLGIIVVLFEVCQQQPNRLLLALGFALLVAAASSAWAQRWHPGRWVLLLGTASYSIYLIHASTISIALRGFRRFAPDAGPFLTFLGLALVGLAAGLVYYFVYERHALVIAQRLFTPKKRKDAAGIGIIEPLRPDN